MLRRTGWFIAASCCTYFLLVFAALAIVMAEGGGLSCYRVCTPTQRFLDDAGTTGTVVAATFSIGVGWWASGRGKRTKTLLVLALGLVVAVLLVEAIN